MYIYVRTYVRVCYVSSVREIVRIDQITETLSHDTVVVGIPIALIVVGATIPRHLPGTTTAVTMETERAEVATDEAETMVVVVVVVAMTMVTTTTIDTGVAVHHLHETITIGNLCVTMATMYIVSIDTSLSTSVAVEVTVTTLPERDTQRGEGIETLVLADYYYYPLFATYNIIITHCLLRI